MTLVQEIEEDVAAGVCVAGVAEGLSAIHQPDCAAAIWQRRLLPGFQSWIDALAPEQLPNARIIVRPNNMHKLVNQICNESGTPDSDDRERFVDDVSALIDTFVGLIPTPYLRLRFDVVNTNACRKFHIDTVTARLICTYRGTGTQYGISTDGTEPQRIFTVPTGAPILLRGKLWPEHPRSGLLHRSPPIEGTGETRLMLVLDPIAEPEGDAR